MAGKNDDLKVAVAELKTDLKWIKDGIRVMHDKQDRTNGRINKLEQHSDDYVTKDFCVKKHDAIKTEASNVSVARLDSRGKVIVALITLAATLLAIAATQIFNFIFHLTG